MKRDEATMILREFFSEYSNSIHSVSLINSGNHGSKEYRLQIGATLNKDSRDSLRMLLKLNGYVMEESRGFILIVDSRQAYTALSIIRELP